MKKARNTIINSIDKLEHWLENNDYKGYDPADGLTSFLRPLTFGNLLLNRLLQQLIWKSPFNLRPLLGVKPLDSNIGRGYIARAQLIMFKLTGREQYKRAALSCLDWLMKNRAPGYDQYCWGKMFDFASRGGWQKRYEPITVWTSLIGQAFLDAYEMFKEKKYLMVAESVARWIIGVPRTRTDSGACINYTASSNGTCTIHNQSMLAAAMLVRTAKHIQNEEWIIVARDAIRYTCMRQQADGSWFYGEGSKWKWIDNFHTGYNLDALKSYGEITGDKTYAENLKRGFAFFKNHFIEESGRPKYYHNRAYPIDSQCAAQSIDTLAYFFDYDKEALELAIRVARWTIDNMQGKDGHFYFMRYPFITITAPMIHWAQATTYKALAHLLIRISKDYHIAD